MERSKLGNVKTPHTEVILDGVERDKKEIEHEDAFEDFCEYKDIRIRKIPRPKGIKSDRGGYEIVNGNQILRSGTTVDVKGHWVSRTQLGSGNHADYTIFMDKFPNKIGIVTFDKMADRNQSGCLRFNRKIGSYYLQEDWYQPILHQNQAGIKKKNVLALVFGVVVLVISSFLIAHFENREKRGVR